MHTEVHVHGDVPLKRGIGTTEVEAALRPWLEYVDVDSLAEATSAREDEPGIALDLRRRVLQICWTGYVGRNFGRAVESALGALCDCVESPAEIDVTYYHEDGRDEFGVVFVGPSPEAIEQAKRTRMIEDVAALLGRQFGDAEIREVTGVIQRLFEERSARSGEPASETVSMATPVRRGNRHLH